MNIIYLDTLFLVNFLCDYIILLCTAKVSGAVIRRGAFALASVVGGIYACICTLKCCLWMNESIIMAAAMIIVCLIAFGKESRLPSCCLAFFIISAIVGGLLTAASINISGRMLFPLSAKKWGLSFLLIYFVLSTFFRKSSVEYRKTYHKILISIDGRTATFTALQDTGNELYDPLTNYPVMICQIDILYQLFPESITVSHSDITELYTKLNEIPSLRQRVKLIPYHTISDAGILVGVKPDLVFINHKPAELIIAFTENQISSTNTYQALY